MHAIPMTLIREANKLHGGHFFDNEAMSFFDSRIECEEAYMNLDTQDAFFVTSECPQPGSRRMYKVRRFDENCRVRTASDHHYLDRAAALEAAKQLAF